MTKLRISQSNGIKRKDNSIHTGQTFQSSETDLCQQQQQLRQAHIVAGLPLRLVPSSA